MVILNPNQFPEAQNPSQCNCENLDELFEASFQEDLPFIGKTSLINRYQNNFWVPENVEHSQLFSHQNIHSCVDESVFEKNITDHLFLNETNFGNVCHPYVSNVKYIEKNLFDYDDISRKNNEFVDRMNDIMTINYLNVTKNKEPTVPKTVVKRKKISNKKSKTKTTPELQQKHIDYLNPTESKTERESSEIVRNAENTSSQGFNQNNPHKLETSFMTKEFKTTSFIDDHFGCSYDCTGTQRANNFSTRKEYHPLLEEDPLNFDTSTCYMEPNFQGIPSRYQRYGIFQREPKICEMRSGNNIHDDNFSFPADPTLMKQNGIPCYCRHPLQTIHLQDYTGSKSSYEISPKIAQKRNRPNTKERRHFTCCPSGKVDQEELSAGKNKQANSRPSGLDMRDKLFDSKPVQMKKEPYFEYYKCPPCHKRYVTPIRNKRQQNDPSKINPSQKIHSDSCFKCDWQCSFLNHPEKEYHKKYTQPRQIMKSIACECVNKEPVKPPTENTIDACKNITIQIFPNCGEQTRVNSGPTSAYLPNKAEEKVLYGSNICSQDTPLEIEQPYVTPIQCQQITNQPCLTEMTSSISYNKEGPCRRYNPKEKSVVRWWNFTRKTKERKTQYESFPSQVKTQDCCVSTSEGYQEDDTQIVTVSMGPRVLPVKRNFVSNDAHLLKTLRGLNKALLKDLFATPCPSSSSACPDECLRKIRGSPMPLCSNDHPPYYSAKPTTTNQCCQYEHESEITCSSYKDLLFECLKYLKGETQTENCWEPIAEECCCCCCSCCQTSNNCCCCQTSNNRCCCHMPNNSTCCNQRTPKYCQKQDVVPPKVVEKKSKLCLCKSVEAKQSVKNFGSTISSQCFKKVESVCTNTEFRPKTSKPSCCKRRCCCCNQSRSCCCCCNKHSSCCKPVQKTHCRAEHYVYCCQCETNPIFGDFKINSKPYREIALKKSIDILTSKINDVVSRETALSSLEEKSEPKFSRCSNTNEKSTNTTYFPKQKRQQENDLIKNITLDLCDLGDKQFSKFGLPSKQYPWCQCSLFSDMPHEIYRLVGIEKFNNFLLEKVYDDPTPCLSPEILYDKERSSTIEQNTGDSKELRKENNLIATLCANLANNKPENNIHETKLCFTNEKIGSDTHGFVVMKSKHIQLQDDLSFAVNHGSKEEPPKSADYMISSPKNPTAEAISNIRNDPKKFLSKPNRSITKVASNISKISSKISKSSWINITNYTPKPFTTRTGLMSVIPSFRDCCRHPPKPMKTIKKKPSSSKNIEISNKISKSSNEHNEKLDQNKAMVHSYESTTESIFVKEENLKEHKREILKPIDHDKPDSNYLRKRQIDIDEISSHLNKISESFDLEKFNEEIRDFYEKCSENPNASTVRDVIIFDKKSVPDIVNKLESQNSINSL